MKKKKESKAVAVPFHGDEILAVRKDGEIWVPINRLCENLGIDRKRQQEKLRNDVRFSWGHMSLTGPDGKKYKMGCIPVDQISGWLFTINSNKVRPELQEKFLTYQKECVHVLHEYFTKGAAVRTEAKAKAIPPSTAEDRRELNQAVRAYVAQAREQDRFINLAMAYKLVNMALGVKSFEELSTDQIDYAVELVKDWTKIEGGGLPLRTDPRQVAEDIAKTLIPVIETISSHANESHRLSNEAVEKASAELVRLNEENRTLRAENERLSSENKKLHDSKFQPYKKELEELKEQIQIDDAHQNQLKEEIAGYINRIKKLEKRLGEIEQSWFKALDQLAEAREKIEIMEKAERKPSFINRILGREIEPEDNGKEAGI